MLCSAHESVDYRLREFTSSSSPGSCTGLFIQTAAGANKIFENVVFEPVWRGKVFEMKVFGAAIDSVKFSSKSELSSRFFGLLKFSVRFEYLGLQNARILEFLSRSN